MSHYAVMGNPISHSKSPFIHRLFADQTSQRMTYIPILVGLNDLESALSEFQKRGGQGVNITLPFKNQAVKLVDTLSERASRARVINTIRFEQDGSRFGDNTDGIGLVRDLCLNHHFSIAGQRVLLLGAGGAAQGVLGPLTDEQPAHLTIANRTENKAVTLAKMFSDSSSVSAATLSDLEGHEFDLVINASSAGLQNEAFSPPNIIFSKNSCYYDLSYGNASRPFLQWAKQHGATFCCNGLGMLIEQAAASFQIWRGLQPKTCSLLKLLSSQI